MATIEVTLKAPDGKRLTVLIDAARASVPHLNEGRILAEERVNSDSQYARFGRWELTGARFSAH